MFDDYDYYEAAYEAEYYENMDEGDDESYAYDGMEDAAMEAHLFGADC